MTAPTFALPAAVYLQQIDADAADRAMVILRDTSIPASHRARRATAEITRHVVSRKRRRIATAALAEQEPAMTTTDCTCCVCELGPTYDGISTTAKHCPDTCTCRLEQAAALAK